MGAWGPGAFENDAAGDWAWEIEDAATEEDAVRIIESALRVTGGASADQYLDADQASRALAAAEIVAAALGRTARDLPESVTDWLAAHRQAVPAAMRELARAAVARVIGPGSELAELWEESGDRTEWLDQVRGLQRYLAEG